MNASYGVNYNSTTGMYYAYDGSVFESYDAAYNYNVDNGLVDDLNTPATYDPNYDPATDVQPTTVQNVINQASAPKKTSSDLSTVLADMFHTTMTTAGTALNQRLNNELQIAQIQANQRIQAAINPKPVSTPAPSSNLAFSGGAVVLGLAAVVGVILIARK